VVKGTTDPGLSFYTEGGSFYMNGTTRFLATVSEEDKGQTRNVCNQTGYESVALIPIRLGPNILGLIHLADCQENMVPLNTVKVLEQVASALGIGIQRTMAEEELRQQREWLRVTLTSIGDAVIATDLAGTITFLNPVAQTLTGWQSEQSVGKPLQAIFRAINEKTPEPREDITQRVLREGVIVTLSNNTALLTRAGQTIPIEDSAAPIKDREGKITGVVLVFHDVSEKRRTQKALRESEQRYSAIFDKSPFAAALTRMPGRNLTEINDAFLKLFGYTRDELVGKNSVDIGISEPDSQEQVAAELEGLGSVRDFECTRFTKSGAQLVLSLNLDWVGIGGEKQLLTTIRDITERKKAEEDLQQRTLELEHLTERLEERVRERTGELEDLSGRLVSAQEDERRRVSYDLHDHVWQALVAIRFEMEQLFSGREGMDRAALQKKSKEIMANLLEAVGKIRSMQGDLWPYILDDIGLLATIDWYCREFEKNHPGLTMVRQDGFVENEIPSSAKIVIYRILQEALSNVAKHSRADRVALRLLKKDQRMEFTVEDNGLGFDPEEVLIKSSPWGGLGLLNLKARTELSGGLFEVESVQGRGTTIRASWPFQENDGIT
ncbi:MAG: PAS domain S-box protein, partial [Deltaproteobacteria bacterium]|nr:PAS domain S-box protein [Deltaproteobacteria bacterium]